MTKELYLIHGRDFKPSEAELKKNWLAALKHGIKRDYPQQADKLLKNIKIKFIYYGDESNSFLRNIGRRYDSENDQEDRKNCLKLLKQYSKGDFTEENYDDVPGSSPFKEGLADSFAGLLNLFGVADNIITKVAPDMKEYWNHDSAFGSNVRMSLSKQLSKSLHKDNDILLISHSLGTLIAYDVLWKFSHYGEYEHIKDKKLSCLLTLGSPLGDETVKDNLKGASAKKLRKYPTCIKKWVNVAAEDDYISHDQSIQNDFEDMISAGFVDSIVDHRIFNLAERGGSSNPHHGGGYLIHPTISKTVVDWLKQR